MKIIATTIKKEQKNRKKNDFVILIKTTRDFQHWECIPGNHAVWRSRSVFGQSDWKTGPGQPEVRALTDHLSYPESKQIWSASVRIYIWKKDEETEEEEKERKDDNDEEDDEK